jgi:hypothetical protein
LYIKYINLRGRNLIVEPNLIQYEKHAQNSRIISINSFDQSI